MSNSDANKLHYNGDPLTLFMLYAQLILGSLLTLGFYSFWGCTNIRRYTIGSISIRQERYQYHGTGPELFAGFVKALTIAVLYILLNLGVLWCGIRLLEWHSDWFIQTVLVINIIALNTLIFYGLHQSLKYKVSRTSWRGIRYCVSGSSWEFTKLCLIKTLLNIVSLGLLIPRSTLEIYSTIMNNLYFGDQKYRFCYQNHNLLKPHLISLLLFIPTLGLSRIWYWAQLRNFMISHLEFMDLKFRSTATAGNLLQLYLTNILLILGTLGLGIPFAIHRSIKFHMEHLNIVGDLDRKRIVKAISPRNKISESQYS